MAPTNPWDAEKVLQLYLLDYMVRKGMNSTAAIFKEEVDISNSPVGTMIDSPNGFLYEWWSIFYEMYTARQLQNQKTGPEAPSTSQTTQVTDNGSIDIPYSIPQLSVNEQRPQQLQIGSDFNENIIEQPADCLLPFKYYDKEPLRYPAKDTDPSLHLINANKLKFPTGSSSNRLLQDIGKQAAQKQLLQGSGLCNSFLGSGVPGTPLDFVQRTTQPFNGMFDTKTNDSLKLVPSSGRHLNSQIWTSLLHAPNHQQQNQLLKIQNQQVSFAQVRAGTAKNQASKLPENNTKCNSQQLKIPNTDSSNKDGQMVVEMAQTTDHQGQHVQQQQLQSQAVVNCKRRKTTLPSTGRESTSLDHGNGAEERAAYENIESFLSDEKEPADQKGFSFQEVGSLHSSQGKVLSCHFSSDGKVLASAGHEKKIFIWNMETFDCVATSEPHSLLITDVRFSSGSTIFATSSFDRTVKIWDAARPTKSLIKLTGHAGQVMSLDFHPRKVDILCSCDSNDVIRLWNVNKRVCTHTSMGGSKQIRFQPRFGKLLATATGNTVNIFDLESDSLLCNLKGHVNDVLFICWDKNGDYVASVSEDSARVWSAASSGKCIHELNSDGNKFQSCIFHPSYAQLLVIGGYQSLELWSPTESSKSWTIPAHKGLIAGLADSPQNDMIASASHDCCVKLWK